MPHLDEIAAFRMHMNPDSIQAWPDPTAKSLARSRLLCNVTGTTPESLLAKATRLLSGVFASALASVPKASYGKYATVDRDEIERTNEVRRLILEYQRSPKDKRPLSIGQFSGAGHRKIVYDQRDRQCDPRRR